MSGGITKFADLSNVEITRRGKISDGNKKENLTIDFLKMILKCELIYFQLCDLAFHLICIK